MKNRKRLILEADEDKQFAKEFFEEFASSKRSTLKKEEPVYKEFPEPISDERILIDKIKKELREELNINDEIQKRIDFLFRNNEFMKGVQKELFKYVESEVRKQVKNFDLHKSVSSLVKEKVETNWKPLANAVCERTISRLAKKMTQEVNIVREMSYSLSSEIRHISMKMPVSPNYEKDITKHIKDVIDKLTFKEESIMIEEKTNANTDGVQR